MAISGAALLVILSAETKKALQPEPKPLIDWAKAAAAQAGVPVSRVVAHAIERLREAPHAED